MLRGGLSQNYNVNVRGGSDIAKYSVSYNHSDEKGILRGNKYVQDNARMKLNVQKYIFNFDASLSLKVTQSQQPQYSIKRCMQWLHWYLYTMKINPPVMV